ncbi:MAG: hypothetical protein JXX29_21940 [Deltaproteobacteria bacterium]|nr:hypothetical protein [Deltaproteobacteria bacterium]MBN2674357.1 hypothetical protein [Deltaproteobacteria bacterium]
MNRFIYHFLSLFFYTATFFGASCGASAVSDDTGHERGTVILTEPLPLYADTDTTGNTTQTESTDARPSDANNYTVPPAPSEPRLNAFINAWSTRPELRTYSSGCERASAIANSSADQQAFQLVSSGWTADAIGRRLLKIADGYQGDVSGESLFNTTVQRMTQGLPWVFSKTDHSKEYACPESSIPANTVHATTVFAEGTPTRKKPSSCYDTPTGAWTLLRQPLSCNDLEVAVSGNSSDRQGSFLSLRFSMTSRAVVAFVPIKGTVATLYVKQTDNFSENNFSPVVTFDFNGDGIMESIWKASFYNEGLTDLWFDVFTVKNNLVVPYPLPFDRTLLFGTEDLNNDKRPDLLLNRVAYSTECWTSFAIEHHGTFLAAESLPNGTFSLTTTTAEKYLKNQCPAPPKQFRTVSDVTCGILWGMKKETIRQHIDAQNAPWVCEYDGTEFPVTGPKKANQQYDALIQAVQFTYPVQFNSNGRLEEK